jgi:hypothetical protein
MSFKQWREVQCQKFLPEGLLIENIIFNLIISDVIATDNVLILPPEYSTCYQNRYSIAWPCQRKPHSGRTMLTTAMCSVRDLRYQVTWIHLYSIHTSCTQNPISQARHLPSTSSSSMTGGTGLLCRNSKSLNSRFRASPPELNKDDCKGQKPQWNIHNQIRFCFM